MMTAEVETKVGAYILPFSELSMKQLAQVGGKNASLGEMMQSLTPYGIRIPDGFAITTSAYREFLEDNSLVDQLTRVLATLDKKNLGNLDEVGKKCRDLVTGAHFPEDLRNAIAGAYRRFREKYGEDVAVAVRSSATAEDSPKASFAGQHDSYLNINSLDELLNSVRLCYASFFNDRAIKYRLDYGFDDMKVSLSVGVQHMVRSDKGSAGVAFTIDPESGNENIIYITGAWGLGETVVQGEVNTDEFYLFNHALEKNKTGIVSRKLGVKQVMMIYGGDNQERTVLQETPAALRDQFVLKDDEVHTLGTWCYQIEKHYGMPMDIEWAKDGVSGDLFIVQARPETVHASHKTAVIKEYSMKTDQKPVLVGKAIGHAVVSGRATIVKSLADSDKVKDGDIIVSDMTNPDWNALLRKAIAIVTNKGGRTSHASIIARELGIPAVVGTLKATTDLKDGETITVSCIGGDEGYVYNGKLAWTEKETDIKKIPHTRTKPMLILADPEKALLHASYPNEGVGLLRMEFIIANSIHIHPMALVNFDALPNDSEKKQIEALTRREVDKKKFFVNTLAEAIGLVAAAFYPKDVIVRMSDFKTNEYARLIGGRSFEPEEENPMLGFRGASRYYSDRYREGFKLECDAIKKVRNDMGLTNVKVMIPFCRTVAEGKAVLNTMKQFGLERGENGLEVYVMAEIPSNILLASEFAKLFDGFSIGSNDLTQLTLGLDRDSAIVSGLFDENNEAVKLLIAQLVETAHKEGRKVGLCGQAPSDHPGFAGFLVGCHIDSISFTPDALIRGIQNIQQAEVDA